MGVVILPKSFNERFDLQNALLASIASNLGDNGIAIGGPKDLQYIVRMGLHKKLLDAGDQLLVTWDGVEHVLDVLGLDQETITDNRYKHSLTVQFHDCIGNAVMAPQQAFYYCENELLVGEYVFTFNNVNYEFTTTEPVPEGGQLVVSAWGTEPYDVDKITTYSDDRVTPIESGITAIVSAKANTLAPINHYGRVRYGSNNYKKSLLRQWLNSNDSDFVWEPQTNYDRPSTSSIFNKGFLYSLPPEFVSVLGVVDKVVARNTVTDDGGSDVLSDKVFLLSRSEVYGTKENNIDEGTIYPYYDGLTNLERRKMLNDAYRYWWLRTPNASNSSNSRNVNSTSGALSHNGALSALGCAPACVII